MNKYISVPMAFGLTVVIWSTTPLGITWSVHSIHPVMAVFLRTLVAVILGLFLIRFLRIEFLWNLHALRSYLFALVGVFGSMLTSGLAATYVPSGLMSVFFGFSPIITGVFASLILREQPLNAAQWLAVAIALVGLIVIFRDDLFVQASALPGIIFLAISVVLFSFSTVIVKQVGVSIHPLSQSVGSMLLSLPLYLASWWLLDGDLPVLSWSDRSLWAILYLAVLGSLLGSVCFYYLLKHAMAKTSVLVTLVTPVFALLLGHVLNHEPLTVNVVLGATLIVLGLSVYGYARRFPSDKEIEVLSGEGPPK